MECAIELKFVPFCIPMASFLVGVKSFKFWPKTMDYSKVFQSNVSWDALSDDILFGRNFSSFRPKTMDYSLWFRSNFLSPHS